MTAKISSTALYTTNMTSTQTQDANAVLGAVAKYTRDSFEYSGSKKENFNTDALFANVDREIDIAKKESKEHAEKQLKKKIDDEVLDRQQRPRVEARKMMMKETGILWTGGLTPESQQVLMQKAPGILAEYSAKKDAEEEQIEKSEE